MVSFDSVVDAYDEGRPAYPAAVFEELEPLAGRRVVDVGAGTGIATQQLVARGCNVVPVDIGSALLQRARHRVPGLAPVVADGVRLPMRDAVADLVCFAQSWHWLDADQRCSEVARVLHDGGLWAAWWSHARADDEAWFTTYWTVVERALPGTHRDERHTDWSATIDSELFEIRHHTIVEWTREVSVDVWMADQASHSYIMVLNDSDRRRLLRSLRDIVEGHFGDGVMRVPYGTWLWVAEKR